MQNTKGALVVRYVGPDNNCRDAGAAKKHYMEDAMDVLLTGNRPEPDFTKAIDCAIKVKK